MDRREFIRLVTLAGVAWKMGAGRNLAFAGDPPANPFAGKWTGEEFEAGHALRDEKLPSLDGAQGMPACDVLVVGGGISGLVAARSLMKAGRSVRVLEQASVAGGNARSEEWGGIAYATGAAYFCAPEEGSPLETLYKEIGVLERAKKVPKGEVFHDGKLVDDIWAGTTDPKNADRAKAIREDWKKIFDDRYPAVPWTEESGWTKEEFEAADRKSFADYLDEIKAPPHIRTLCEYYCWSSFGGKASEISSYAGLNFITAEFGDILALPGGNAAIAKALVASFDAKLVTVDTGTLAVRVEEAGGGVTVMALTGGKPRAYAAKAAILAVPRFVIPRIVPAFPKERAKLVKKVKYNAYLVANVLLTKRPSHEWYDAYTLDTLDPQKCGWTDLIVADFVVEKKTDRCVLTAYRGLPYPEGRDELLTEGSYATLKAAVMKDLEKVLPGLGLKKEDVADINLSRWGHPLVQARPGQLADRLMEQISEPLGRIAFAHQDRWGIPAIENAIEAANLAVEEVEDVLK
ncbi:MAG: FAD-dependent oxidoreductase [Planctomycetia bacterium]|nr:FAD-dependent oxidoreductase [Planctomycetia bacterium]